MGKTFRARPRRCWTAVSACACVALMPSTAWAQGASQPSADAVALSFGAASTRMEQTSAGIASADHAVAAARETRAAVATLHRPIVTASAQYLEYQKTLSVDLSGTKADALDSTQSALAGLPSTLPPVFQQVAGEIVGRLSQALPGIFAQIPDTLSYRYRDDVFRPTVQAVLPLYTGGAIGAVQRGAGAGAALAEAQADRARRLAQVNLVRVYFGQLAATSFATSTRESRDALSSLYSDAVALERTGVIAHAQTLEAMVALDTAERAYQRALLADESARMELAQVLDYDAVRPTTPLFVQSRPLPPGASFVGGEDRLPETRVADATREVAGAAADLARSRYLPQAYAFGEYNLNRNSALPVEPDWIVGVGVRMTLLSNVDRGHTLAAARQQEAAASDASAEARKTARIATLRAWNLTEAARRSFLLLDSSMAAATENLRVQRVAFREGEATLTIVLGAEAALAAARTQRVATAYEYDLALAGLLTAADRLDEFDGFISRADHRIAPEPQP